MHCFCRREILFYLCSHLYIFFILTRNLQPCFVSFQDEIHERDRFSDFMLAILRYLKTAFWFKLFLDTCIISNYSPFDVQLKAGYVDNYHYCVRVYCSCVYTLSVIHERGAELCFLPAFFLFGCVYRPCLCEPLSMQLSHLSIKVVALTRFPDAVDLILKLNRKS